MSASTATDASNGTMTNGTGLESAALGAGFWTCSVSVAALCTSDGFRAVAQVIVVAQVVPRGGAIDQNGGRGAAAPGDKIHPVDDERKTFHRAREDAGRQNLIDEHAAGDGDGCAGEFAGIGLAGGDHRHGVRRGRRGRRGVKAGGVDGTASRAGAALAGDAALHGPGNIGIGRAGDGSEELLRGRRAAGCRDEQIVRGNRDGYWDRRCR